VVELCLLFAALFLLVVGNIGTYVAIEVSPFDNKKIPSPSPDVP